MKTLISLTLLTVAIAGPAAAAPDAQVCLSKDRMQAEARISACSELILSGYRQAPAYVNRGQAYLVIGDNDRAIGDFNTALSIDPANGDAFSGRGRAYAQKREFSKAIDNYDKAIKIRPTADDHARRGHAHLHSSWPSYRQAVADFTAALNLKPNWAEALNNRCWARALWRQDLELALSDCDLALQLKPDLARARDSRGFVYFRLERFEDALADYEEVLRSSPDSAGALYMRGVIKLKLKDASGHADLARAMRLDGGIAGMYSTYGVQR